MAVHLRYAGSICVEPRVIGLLKAMMLDPPARLHRHEGRRRVQGTRPRAQQALETTSLPEGNRMGLVLTCRRSSRHSRNIAWKNVHNDEDWESHGATWSWLLRLPLGHGKGHPPAPPALQIMVKATFGAWPGGSMTRKRPMSVAPPITMTQQDREAA